MGKQTAVLMVLLLALGIGACSASGAPIFQVELGPMQSLVVGESGSIRIDLITVANLFSGLDQDDMQHPFELEASVDPAEGPVELLRFSRGVSEKSVDRVKTIVFVSGESDLSAQLEIRCKEPGTAEVKVAALAKEGELYDEAVTQISCAKKVTNGGGGTEGDSDNGTGATAGLEPPPIANPFTVEVTNLEDPGCGGVVASGDGHAELHPGENGFVLWLYDPLGLGIGGNSEDGLFAIYDGPKSAGVGEVAPRSLLVRDFLFDDPSASMDVEETRFTEEFPDGCVRSYTARYDFEDGRVFDFLRSIPSGGSGGATVVDPNLEHEDGSYTMDGRFVDGQHGQLYFVFTTVSGVDTYFDLTQIFPETDGNFQTEIPVDPPTGTFMAVELTVNGVTVLSSSGDAK